MRTTILSLVVLLAPLAAHAGEGSEDICAAYAEYAETAESAHQYGVALSTSLESAGGNSSLRAIVIAAYSVPRLTSDWGQKRAISDFRDSVHLACLKQKGR